MQSDHYTSNSSPFTHDPFSSSAFAPTRSRQPHTPVINASFSTPVTPATSYHSPYSDSISWPQASTSELPLDDLFATEDTLDTSFTNFDPLDFSVLDNMSQSAHSMSPEGSRATSKRKHDLDENWLVNDQSTLSIIDLQDPSWTLESASQPLLNTQLLIQEPSPGSSLVSTADASPSIEGPQLSPLKSAVETSNDDASARDLRRQRNTVAARKYRQKRLDRITELEQALAKTEKERDDLKLQVERWKMKAEVLQEMAKRD